MFPVKQTDKKIKLKDENTLIKYLIAPYTLSIEHKEHKRKELKKQKYNT